MMNKNRTRTTGRIKYALFAPLAAALLLVSNISCTSTEKKNGQATSSEEQTPTTNNAQEDNILRIVEVEADDTLRIVEEDHIFQVVEEAPEFPGGPKECRAFLLKNIKYPQISQENGVQGRVIVQFVVNADGSITDPTVVRGVDPYLDKEALRVINLMPKWKPGKQRGKAVRVRYTQPVVFKLN